MLSNRDWVINIEKAAAKVAAEYGQKVVDFVFCRYAANSLEDLAFCYYSEVFCDLEQTANDQRLHSRPKQSIKLLFRKPAHLLRGHEVCSQAADGRKFI